MQLQDYAAFSLRQHAGRVDGTLDPAKVQTWTQRHGEALRAFPDLQNRFRDAANASRAIDDAIATRKTAIDAYQTGAFAKVAGLSNPSDVKRAVGGILNSQTNVAQMRDLALTAKRNPQAYAGLRKSVVEYLQDRFIGNTEAGTSGQGTIKAEAFQSFVKRNDAALRYVFNEPEMQSLRDIAADLQRSNRSLSAVKIPGQSNTAQDLAQLAKGQPSILKRLLMESAGAAAGWFTAGPAGSAVGWLGSRTVGALRDAGFKRTDDILREAMLDPVLARALLAKAPPKPDTGNAHVLMAVLRRHALMGAAVGASNSERRAIGG